MVAIAVFLIVLGLGYMASQPADTGETIDTPDIEQADIPEAPDEVAPVTDNETETIETNATTNITTKIHKTKQ